MRSNKEKIQAVCFESAGDFPARSKHAEVKRKRDQRFALIQLKNHRKFPLCEQRASHRRRKKELGNGE